MNPFILVLIYVALFSCDQPRELENTSVGADMTEVIVNGHDRFFRIHRHDFELRTAQNDSMEVDDSKLLTLFRDQKEIYTHIAFLEEGDCSALHLELGGCNVQGDELIFYSYWAASDRQPMSLVPFGFRKQIYFVDERGELIAQEASIYIEDTVDKEAGKDSFYTAHDTWNHKGLAFLNTASEDPTSLRARTDYI